ncbi:MAG: transglutaminase domain-containing protein [Myxococcota bacterium]
MTDGPGEAAAERSRAFRERARLEADRYGPDPWIFVRELLQNSRDAGANRVTFTVGESERPEGTVEWVACYDDGEGMTFEHARRYLFALYASSKEDRKNQAGKFGVGFWSILRFDPQAIIIRSYPRNGEPWTIRLDGALERAEHLEPPTRPGTEIVLEKPKGDGRLEHRIYDAVWQSARYLHRRDAVDQPLPVTINGRSANAEFGLEAPSASFRRRSVRGVVGLGRAPRVELFCRGLRVRSAACLEDLVAPAGRHTARIRVQFPELPAGLAPVALLESNALEVMLSRSDARDGRALARLVKLAQRELERLVERQLSFARPVAWYRRPIEQLRTRLRDSLAWRTVAGSAVGAVAAVLLSLWLWGSGGADDSDPASSSSSVAVTGVTPGSSSDRIYEDLGRRYRGPRVDVLAPGAVESVRLRYSPSHDRLHFAALTFPELLDDGAPNHSARVRVAGMYVGATCERECFDVSLPIRGKGTVRLPVPTGHRIVRGSVFLDEQTFALHVTDAGHPAVDLGRGTEGLLRYQTTPSVDPTAAPLVRVVPGLSRDLQALTHGLSPLSVNDKVGDLLAFVKDNVAYDRSEVMARLHAEEQARGTGFIQRTLALGKGDCDVQNGLLVALLQASDVPARLAVGYLGVDGKALPWLHAWVEYRDERGQWHIADASERVRSSAASPSSPSSPSERVAVAPGRPGPVPTAEGPSDDVPAVEPMAGPSTPVESASSSPTPASVSKESATSKGDATIPASTAASAAAPPEDRWPAWLWPLLSLSLLLAAIASLVGGRTRRHFKLDDSADLSRLLQGVLQQPGAFGAMSALLYRPLVPLVEDRAISLHRARELAAKGRLYRTHEGSGLARRAARAGAAVLDTQSPEGKTVADALGAIDLDTWDERLRGSWTTPLVDELNHMLRKRRERWSLRVVSRVSGQIAALDLDGLRTRIPGLHGSRVVVVDASCPWLVEAEAHHEQTPRAVVFTVLDRVTDHLDLPEDRRAALLSEGARAALLESFPVGPQS